MNQKVNPSVVAELFAAADRTESPEVQEDLFPLYDILLTRLDQDGGRELVSCNWGMLPFWWQPSDKHKTFSVWPDETKPPSNGVSPIRWFLSPMRVSPDIESATIEC